MTFEAVIVPHRSLGRRGLLVLMGVLGALSGGVATGLWLVGAWPAVGFTGIEAGLAIWLLRRHAQGARSSEMLFLSDAGLRVTRVDGRGRRSEQVLPTAWLRAAIEDRPGRTPALVLRGNRWSLEVAASLGEDEKRSLATALDGALQRHHHPVFDNEQLREPGP